MAFPRKIALSALALSAIPVLCFVILSSREGVSTYDARNVFTPCIEVGKDREHWAKPGCSGVSRVGAEEAPIRFNSFGIRDPERAPKAAKGVVRILMLGSSNTLGLGLPEEGSLPRQLEAALRGKGLKVEVINAAMVGYCAIQTSFRYRELLERYSPALVLYQMVPGACPIFDGAWEDRVVWDQGLPRRLSRAPARGMFSFVNGPVFASPSLFFLWLTLADQLKKVLFTWKVALAGGEEGRADAYLAPTLRYLRFMQAEAAGKGAELVAVSHRMGVFTQSVPAQLHVGIASALSKLMVHPGIPQELIFAKVEAAGVPMLVPKFDVRKFVIPGDVHFSGAGNQEFARLLAEQLAARPPFRKP